ncbi:hypothetical protein AVEN_51034-1, partial [Araneus ventricosus]
DKPLSEGADTTQPKDADTPPPEDADTTPIDSMIRYHRAMIRLQ